MKLGGGPYISDPSWLRLEEVEDKANDVSADVRIRWCVISVGTREMSYRHRWARKDEVDSLWECDVEELRRDGLDVYRMSGVPDLNGLRWEEMWKSVSQRRDAMRGIRVCVRVCINLGVRVDRAARFM